MKKLRLVSGGKSKNKKNTTTRSTINPLSILLANTYCLYLKTQNYHWNVKGPYFSALHLLFEKQYEALGDAADVIAERIRALNAHSPGSFVEFSRLKTLSEATPGTSWKKMIENLTNDHQMIIDMLNKFLGEKSIQEDEGTQDLLIERLREHEKIHWMLKSHLE